VINPVGSHVDFLLDIGADRVPHGGRTLLTHLEGTRRLLIAWNAPLAWCDAGLCHSVYGTDRFEHALLDSGGRSRLQRVIGVEAERLVWLFATLDRGLVLQEPSPLEALPEIWALRNIHFANAVEQLAVARASPTREYWAGFPARHLLPRAARARKMLRQGSCLRDVFGAAIGLQQGALGALENR
jgi:hypothetical protein